MALFFVLISASDSAWKYKQETNFFQGRNVLAHPVCKRRMQANILRLFVFLLLFISFAKWEQEEREREREREREKERKREREILARGFHLVGINNLNYFKGIPSDPPLLWRLSWPPAYL